MTFPLMLKKPSAFLPVGMSSAALAAVLIHLVLHGVAPQADEGTAAHIWQLMLAAQVPIILFFTIRWLPQNPKYAVATLVLQATAILAALTPVYLLHW
jgi:hypothetical protein